MSKNRLADVNDRLNETTKELNAIRNGEMAETTRIGSGEDAEEFDHEAWLMAERADLLDQRTELRKAVTPQGTVAYEG